MSDKKSSDSGPPRRRGERAVSFSVGYVLTVAIAVLLISGVLLATGQVVRNQRIQTIEGEATVVGDQIAGSLTEADRLVQQGGNDSNVSIAPELPARLAGQPYTVTLRANSTDGVIIVQTQGPRVTVATAFTHETEIRNASVAGNDIRVIYRGSGNSPDQKLTIVEGDG